MGSLKSSNDFLPKSEIERTLYNRRKPIILLVMVMFLVFNLVGCAVQGLAIAYAAWAIQPVQIDQEKYNDAQKLNLELSHRFSQLKLARPNDVNVIATLAAVTNAKPAEVSLTDINIGAEKTIITGITQNLDVANKYCNDIVLPGKKTQIDTVKTNQAGNTAANTVPIAQQGKEIKFTISILTKDKGGDTK